MSNPWSSDPSQPELKRTLGGFQVFAISFAFISVAVGIFATYDEVLTTAGPVGIWLWIVAAVGQTLVALVVAQFAARIALSGSSYQWASRLANPKVGWLFGWLAFWYLAIAVVAMDNALASQALMPLLGMGEDEDTARVITVVDPGRPGRAGDRLDPAARHVHLRAPWPSRSASSWSWSSPSRWSWCSPAAGTSAT